MPEYNGHPSRAHWNVALWIANDEDTYALAMRVIAQHRAPSSGGLKAAARLMLNHLPNRTPDGVPYTFATVRHALEGLAS